MYRGFDVKGKKDNGDEFSTTCGDGGYELYVCYDDQNRLITNDSFVFGETYNHNSINITASASIVANGDAVLVQYDFVNTATSEKTIKLGLKADTDLNNNDRAPLHLEGNGITIVDPNNGDPITFFIKPLVTDFTTRWIGGLGDSSANLYTNAAYNDIEDVDSSLTFSWTVTVPAGGTVNRYLVMGAGDATVVANVESSLATITSQITDSTTSSGDADETSNETNNETNNETKQGGVEDWFGELLTDISIATAEIKNTKTGQTVVYEGNAALPYEVMKELEDNPDATLNYKLTYKGESYDLYIPGKFVQTSIDIKWYGPEWLIGHFGNITKDTAVSGEYTVVKGDCVTMIANKLGVTVDHLKELNDFDNINLIYPGNIIYY